MDLISSAGVAIALETPDASNNKILMLAANYTDDLLISWSALIFKHYKYAVN